jgi:hypothetical protein
MIDVTGVDTVELVKKAYELSRPQGMGMMHFDPTPLTDDEAKSLMNDDGSCRLDYVRGRACKFDVSVNGDKTSIRSPWYDHTDQNLVDLLAHVGITYEPGKDEHGCACNCDTCRIKQGKEALGSKGGFK